MPGLLRTASIVKEGIVGRPRRLRRVRHPARAPPGRRRSTERWLTIDAPRLHERRPMGRERDDGEWIVTVLIALLAVALIFFLILR
jgi:hypothetical protein